MMRPALHPNLRIPTPAVCVPAWVRFLYRQGASSREVSRVLSIRPAFARRRHAS